MGGGCHHHLLGGDQDLGAEPPADVGGDAADPVLLEAKGFGHRVPDLERALGRGVDREAAGFGHGQDGVALDRHRGQALVGEAPADDYLGALQRVARLRIAGVDLESEVGAMLREGDRGPGAHGPEDRHLGKNKECR